LAKNTALGQLIPLYPPLGPFFTAWRRRGEREERDVTEGEGEEEGKAKGGRKRDRGLSSCSMKNIKSPFFFSLAPHVERLYRLLSLHSTRSLFLLSHSTSKRSYHCLFLKRFSLLPSSTMEPNYRFLSRSLQQPLRRAL